MDFRKVLAAGALSCSLVFSGVAVSSHAFAVEFSDTSGMSTETSINKLVSLGVMKYPGENFNPDGALTRSEFAYMVNKVMTLSSGKKVGFKDLSFKNSNYTNVLKLVNNGYLSASKGYVKSGKGVTYAEMSKVLAQGLGLKKTWTNRSVDYLFYLVKKDVLDIDTDLDAVVTREEAAVAFDKFITQNETFTIVKGIVMSTNKFTINNGAEYRTYKFANNASVFVDDQAMALDDVQVGSPVTLYLNKKGQVAYYAGEFLDAETGPIVLKSPNIVIGTKALTKSFNLDAFVAALPNNPSQFFSIKQIDIYSKAGVNFEGQAYFTNADEVTAVYPYIASAEDMPITVNGSKVTVGISGDVTETFNTFPDVSVTLDGKEATLADLKGDEKTSFTASFEADKTGYITSITATKVVAGK
jgi:hypothetical protein